MATPTSGSAATIVIHANVAVGDRRSKRMKVATSTTQTTCATLSRSAHDKLIAETLDRLAVGKPNAPQWRPNRRHRQAWRLDADWAVELPPRRHARPWLFRPASGARGWHWPLHPSGK